VLGNEKTYEDLLKAAYIERDQAKRELANSKAELDVMSTRYALMSDLVQDLHRQEGANPNE